MRRLLLFTLAIPLAVMFVMGLAGALIWFIFLLPLVCVPYAFFTGELRFLLFTVWGVYGMLFMFLSDMIDRAIDHEIDFVLGSAVFQIFVIFTALSVLHYFGVVLL